MLPVRMNCPDTDRIPEQSEGGWKRGKGERTTLPNARIVERARVRGGDDAQAFRGQRR